MRKMTEKIKNKATQLHTQMMLRMAGVKVEDGDHLLEVLGTIIIAVVILIFFRAQITALFNNAIKNTTNSVNGLFTNVTAS